MSEPDARSPADEQTEELVNQRRRESLTRLAKYTAPAMLAALMSTSEKAAARIS